MAKTTVKHIVAEWLRDNDYDGLINDDAECGCAIENLVPCEGVCDMCEPGYVFHCAECANAHCENYEECTFVVSSEADYCEPKYRFEPECERGEQ